MEVRMSLLKAKIVPRSQIVHLVQVVWEIVPRSQIVHLVQVVWAIAIMSIMPV